MKPAIMRSSVVLPQPEGPSRKNNSPGSMVSETRSTAVVVRGLPAPGAIAGYVLLSSWIVMLVVIAEASVAICPIRRVCPRRGSVLACS
jgi:hypothetical protein